MKVNLVVNVHSWKIPVLTFPSIFGVSVFKRRLLALRDFHTPSSYVSSLPPLRKCYHSYPILPANNLIITLALSRFYPLWTEIEGGQWARRLQIWRRWWRIHHFTAICIISYISGMNALGIFKMTMRAVKVETFYVFCILSNYNRWVSRKLNQDQRLQKDKPMQVSWKA